MHSSLKNEPQKEKKNYPTKLCRRRQHLPKESQRDTSKKYLLQHPWHARLYRYFHLGIAAFSECCFYGPIGLVSWPANGLRIWNNERMMESNPCPDFFLAVLDIPNVRANLPGFSRSILFTVKPGYPICAGWNLHRFLDRQIQNSWCSKMPSTHVQVSTNPYFTVQWGFPEKKNAPKILQSQNQNQSKCSTGSQ